MYVRQSHNCYDPSKLEFSKMECSNGGSYKIKLVIVTLLLPSILGFQYRHGLPNGGDVLHEVSLNREEQDILDDNSLLGQGPESDATINELLRWRIPVTPLFLVNEQLRKQKQDEKKEYYEGWTKMHRVKRSPGDDSEDLVPQKSQKGRAIPGIKVDTGNPIHSTRHTRDLSGSNNGNQEFLYFAAQSLKAVEEAVSSVQNAAVAANTAARLAQVATDSVKAAKDMLEAARASHAKIANNGNPPYAAQGFQQNMHMQTFPPQSSFPAQNSPFNLMMGGSYGNFPMQSSQLQPPQLQSQPSVMFPPGFIPSSSSSYSSSSYSNSEQYSNNNLENPGVESSTLSPLDSAGAEDPAVKSSADSLPVTEQPAPQDNSAAQKNKPTPKPSRPPAKKG